MSFDFLESLRSNHPLERGTSAAGASVPADFSDAKLEQCIDFQAGLMAIALTPEEQRAACAELTRLVNLRSPAQVERMERARGLR